MKNLFFTMSKMKNYGLNFVTHRGAQEHIDPGQSKEMPLYEEPMGDDEIIKYYDVRYKSLGLDTKILNNGISVDDRPINAIEKAIKANDPVKEEIKEEVKEEVVEKADEGSVVEPLVEDKEVTEEVTEEVTPAATDDVDSWDMNKLREFVKENNIEVSGKSKDAFIKAIKDFKSKE